jgi:hypothetical protein
MKVKLPLSLINHYATKTYVEMDVYTHMFLTPPQAEVSGQFHAQSTLPLGKILQYPLDRWAP